MLYPRSRNISSFHRIYIIYLYLPPFFPQFIHHFYLFLSRFILPPVFQIFPSSRSQYIQDTQISSRCNIYFIAIRYLLPLSFFKKFSNVFTLFSRTNIARQFAFVLRPADFQRYFQLHCYWQNNPNKSNGNIKLY